MMMMMMMIMMMMGVIGVVDSKRLVMNTNGSFRIAQIADLHFGGRFALTHSSLHICLQRATTRSLSLSLTHSLYLSHTHTHTHHTPSPTRSFMFFITQRVRTRHGVQQVIS